ncbi:MAG: ATP-binding cassette domain-containing protein, partial [Solirubrobacterales bacterium]
MITGSDVVAADVAGGPVGSPAASVAVTLRAIGKSYPGVQALRGVDLDIRTGEIHGFVGENGAGKSTLLKILAGAHAPSHGSIEVFGRPVSLSSPKDARALGIATVYQELTVLPARSALANVFLGQEK